MKLNCWSWEMLAVIRQFTSAEKSLLRRVSGSEQFWNWRFLKCIWWYRRRVFQHADRACVGLGSVVGLHCTRLSTHSNHQPAFPFLCLPKFQHCMGCFLLIMNLACLIFLPLSWPATFSNKARLKYFPIWEGYGTLNCPHSYHLCPHSPLHPSHVPCKQRDSRAGRKIPWAGVL